MSLALILFLEGILTFISPCILPLLPVYASYFVGGNKVDGKAGTRVSLFRISAFIIGFTLVFVSMGLLSGLISQYLIMYKRVIQLVTGTIVIVTGLTMLGLFRRLSFLNLPQLLPQFNFKPKKNQSFGHLIVFGAVFALGWTPCLSTYLGTALLMASQSGSALLGGGLLLAYSLGMGLPFLVTTYLLDSFKQTFSWIKNHFHAINLFSGIMMVLVGIAMATGWIDYLQLLVQR